MTNKVELIELVANSTNLSKVAVQSLLNATINTIVKTVAKGASVSLIGFGSFSSGKRAARIGRNPQTGEVLHIPAAKTVKFSAGKAFKDAVNKRK